jgi:glucose-6-phosphate 1-dehydrogenase
MASQAEHNGSFTTIVIFGASGDLAQRKLIPALYNNYRKGRMPQGFQIVGVSRSAMSHDDFRQRMHDATAEFSGETLDDAKWRKFAAGLYYFASDATQADGIKALDTFLSDQEAAHAGEANRLYYLSTAPNLYEPIAQQLGQQGMARGTDQGAGWRRLIVEKPFGYDLPTAHALNEALHAWFDESQIYRIDHYLGKETAQNVLYLRFANIIFEPIWNRNFIDHVQITVAETVDVGHRGDYYDDSGVLRDMFQNHLLQLVALVAMEPPNSLTSLDIRDERHKVLRAVRPVNLTETVRAQYSDYRQAKGVAPDSQTPTYAALKLYIDNWRWQGVPFYLRSGKALKSKVSEIAVHFKQPALKMFDAPAGTRTETNILSLCIQPDEGAHLTIEAKLPDSSEIKPVDLEFHYRTSFNISTPEAYERLLLDALLGDSSLFIRSSTIETAWQIIDPILAGWAGKPQHSPLVTYDRGTWGPVEADELLTLDGRRWWVSCCEH